MSRVSLDTIIDAVALDAGVTAEDLKGQRRVRRFARPRQRVCWLARQIRPDLSLPYIGRQLGDRDHTTVLHGVRTIAELIAKDPLERETCQDLRRLLTGERGEAAEGAYSAEREKRSAERLRRLMEEGAVPSVPEIPAPDLKLLRAALGGAGILGCAAHARVEPWAAQQRLRQLVQSLAATAGAAAVFPELRVNRLS